LPRLAFSTRIFVAFLVWWGVCAWKPWYPSDWLLENALTVLVVAILVATRRRFRFSDLSYALIAAFLALHTLGAHYTYAKVPYEAWTARLGFSIDALCGFERNQFDRLVHFLFGVLVAYPVREVFRRIADVRGFWSYYLPLDLVMSMSMLYELIEWAAALVVGEELGMAYLGAQGDVWDAHKDMALASLGALIALLVIAQGQRDRGPRAPQDRDERSARPPTAADGAG
jgi:putative membrane protein